MESWGNCVEGGLRRLTGFNQWRVYLGSNAFKSKGFEVVTAQWVEGLKEVFEGVQMEVQSKGAQRGFQKASKLQWGLEFKGKIASERNLMKIIYCEYSFYGEFKKSKLQNPQPNIKIIPRFSYRPPLSTSHHSQPPTTPKLLPLPTSHPSQLPTPPNLTPFPPSYYFPKSSIQFVMKYPPDTD